MGRSISLTSLDLWSCLTITKIINHPEHLVNEFWEQGFEMLRFSSIYSYILTARIYHIHWLVNRKL